MTKQEQRGLDRWARREVRRLNAIDWPAALVGWAIVLGALTLFGAAVGSNLTTRELVLELVLVVAGMASTALGWLLAVRRHRPAAVRHRRALAPAAPPEVAT